MLLERNCLKQRSPCWRRGKELAFLGIARSSAFVRAPEGNGCAERFIRTLQENLLWIGTFETVEALRQVLLTLREITDATWLLERHGLGLPAATRSEQLPSMVEVTWDQSWWVRRRGRYRRTKW
jgi:hypothetical protein